MRLWFKRTSLPVLPALCFHFLPCSFSIFLELSWKICFVIQDPGFWLVVVIRKIVNNVCHYSSDLAKCRSNLLHISFWRFIVFCCCYILANKCQFWQLCLNVYVFSLNCASFAAWTNRYLKDLSSWKKLYVSSVWLTVAFVLSILLDIDIQLSWR